MATLGTLPQSNVVSEIGFQWAENVFFHCLNVSLPLSMPSYLNLKFYF